MKRTAFYQKQLFLFLRTFWSVQSRLIIRGKSRQLLPYTSSVQADYVQGPFLQWGLAFLICLSTFHCPTTKPVSVCLCHNAACNFADLFPCRLTFIFPHQCNGIWWSVWQARDNLITHPYQILCVHANRIFQLLESLGFICFQELFSALSICPPLLDFHGSSLLCKEKILQVCIFF